MKVSNFTALIFLYILQNQIKSDVLFRLRVALKKRMKILFFSIYPSLHRRRTVSGFKPVLCSRRTAVRQHQNNSQPLTFLSFDLFEKVFRTLRSTTKGVASGHHHLLQKVDENFIFKILSANTSRLPIGNAPTCCLQHRIRWVGKSHPKEDEE